jgi:hypothetical protein
LKIKYPNLYIYIYPERGWFGKLIAKGNCCKFDVYFIFKTEKQLFTKGKTILKQALKKIAQACLTYNGIEVPETFK